jgi:hypothetical protein
MTDKHKHNFENLAKHPELADKAKPYCLPVETFKNFEICLNCFELRRTAKATLKRMFW